MRVHTGEKPFACKYEGCRKAFAQAADLKQHIRTHTGDRPYKCQHKGCTRAFTSASNLKQHVRVHQSALEFLASNVHTSTRPFRVALQATASRPVLSASQRQGQTLSRVVSSASAAGAAASAASAAGASNRSNGVSASQHTERGQLLVAAPRAASGPGGTPATAVNLAIRRLVPNAAGGVFRGVNTIAASSTQPVVVEARPVTVRPNAVSAVVMPSSPKVLLERRRPASPGAGSPGAATAASGAPDL